jgi:hypothetical protein
MVLGWWGIAAAQQPFPAEDSWRGLTRGAVALEESEGDTSSEEPAQDLVGSAELAVLSWSATDEAVFFRLHVLGDPAPLQATWALLVDLDGDALDFELLVQVSGASHRLDVLSNVTAADGTWVEDVSTVDPLGFGALATGEVRFTQSGEGWWVELQLARAAAESLGWTATTAVRAAGVTSDYWPLGTTDVAGCDPELDDCTRLDLVLSDPITLDADLDGAPDPLEQIAGTDPLDPDTDDDGLLDDAELDDVLADGTSDALQCDSDGDGLSDGTELGLTAPASGTDLEARCFVADADPSTTTNPHDPDSDGGGLLDGQEDANQDGALDPWETDPLLPGDDTDTDGDTVADLYDDLFGAGMDEDSDGDTLPDSVEGQGDSDGDDLPDFADLDSDDDTLSDTLEGAADSDGDGAEDFRDLDSDDDGLADALEGLVDSDGDGLADLRDTDSDGDGMSDQLEGDADTDGDGVRDSLDLDSDEDGLLDRLEGELDSDEDGLRDSIDLDSDNDGVLDQIEGDDDTDGDDRPDRLDTDSDNDGLPDGIEGEGDEDCDGDIDRLDSDPDDGACETLTPPTGGDGVPPDPIEGKPESGGCGCQTSSPAGLPGLLLALLSCLSCRIRLGWGAAAR